MKMSLKKKSFMFIFSVYSELSKYALFSRMNEILLSLSGAGNDHLPFRMRPVVENIALTGTGVLLPEG